MLKYEILPTLPKRLARLEELAHNLWWCWNHEAIDLFRRLDGDLWEEVGHNPVRLLGEIAQERLEEAVREEGFLAHMDQVLEVFDRYMRQKTWYQKNASTTSGCVAYFAAEFGLTECLAIYSGGLAVLAGDHLKAASDLGVPVLGIGLLYRKGYFQQYLNESGWQQEAYADNDFHTLPLQLEQDAAGQPLGIEVAYPAGPVQAQIWRVQVGRVPLYLLDTDLESNQPEDRRITAHLYGGDMEMRVRQEILLGVGGVRALQALGKQPTVCHMNEGHSAFLGLERIRLLMEQMVREYTEQFYLSADKQWRRHIAKGAKEARTAAVWKRHLRVHWGEIRVERLEDRREEALRVGQKIEIEAEVHLGEIVPRDVVVELYHGRIGSDGQIVDGEPVAMEWETSTGDGKHLLRGAVSCRTSGLYGCRLRVRPRSKDEMDYWEPDLFFFD